MTGVVSKFLDQVAAVVEPDEGGSTSQSNTAADKSVAAQLPKSKAKAPQVTPLEGNFQLATPMIDWNWPVASAGTIPLLQLYMADQLPASVENGATYAASAGSFFSNYRAFLEMIDKKRFPAKQMLDAALRATETPKHPANQGKAPVGWSKVIKSGVVRWAPNWVATQTPQNWMMKVKSHQISNPATMAIDFKRSDLTRGLITQPTKGSHARENQLGRFSKVLVSAKDWGRVDLYPGKWYNSALLKLGQNYVPNAKTFFAADGLLRGRVSSFLVGYDISVSFTGDAGLSTTDNAAIRANPNLEVLGMELKLNAAAASKKGAEATITYQTVAKSPVIVAVGIERFALVKSTTNTRKRPMTKVTLKTTGDNKENISVIRIKKAGVVVFRWGGENGHSFSDKPDIPAGDYTVEFEVPGFRNTEQISVNGHAGVLTVEDNDDDYAIDFDQS